jgi:hypothetical protein
VFHLIILHSENVVIPAKAGIQVLNGIARFARDLKITLNQ